MKKIVWLAFISFGLPVCFSILLFMQIMSVFETEGALKSAEDVVGEETAIYQTIQSKTAPYYSELREKLAEVRLGTREYYSWDMKIEKSDVDEEGNEITVEESVTVYPTVLRRVNYVPESVIIGYLLMCEGIETGSAQINTQKLNEFLEKTNTVTVTAEYTETGARTFWVENKILSINEIAQLFFGTEKERERFQIICQAYGEYFNENRAIVILENDEEVERNITIASASQVPLYLQYDAAWKDVPYGNSTMKKTGCCPTCLAMVFSYFQGRSIYPTEVVAWAGNRYYVSGSGTAWTIFEPAAAHWNIGCVNIGKDAEKMTDALRKGKLVVASMGPGTFTKGGHFIVLTGITDSGKIKVNDPNDSSMKNHAGMEFAVSLIIRECKNMWMFG